MGETGACSAARCRCTRALGRTLSARCRPRCAGARPARSLSQLAAPQPWRSLKGQTPRVSTRPTGPGSRLGVAWVPVDHLARDCLDS
eukprot:1154319-Pyramimonas_sp.AAC.1